MEKHQDAYGQQLLAQLNGGELTAELIERDDEFIHTGAEAGLYFSGYEDWPPIEQQAIAGAKGKVLDIGCGAGWHSLYLQEKGLDVTAIDNSPGAVEVCRMRGVRDAIVCPIGDIGRFEPGSFDTILMLGNNVGLLGDPQNASSKNWPASRPPRPRSSPAPATLTRRTTPSIWNITSSTANAAECPDS